MGQGSSNSGSEGDDGGGGSGSSGGGGNDYFDLWVLPDEGGHSSSIPGDARDVQLSLSPQDNNGKSDEAFYTVFNTQFEQWSLVGTYKNQEFLSESGGSGTGFIGIDTQLLTGNGFAKLVYTGSSSNGKTQTLKRRLRVDNDAPVIYNLMVLPTQNPDIGMIEATIIERNGQKYQAGIKPESIQVYFDGPGQILEPSIFYDPEDGKFTAEFSGYAAYNAAQQGQPENSFGFELVAEDHVGNEVSSRPPKDNLKLDIEADLWFSPHADSTKKQAHFQVVDVDNANVSWTVDIRRGGQVYKTYTGSGTQPLVWDGLFNGEPVPEGKYNIVLKNAKQPGKERVREVAKVGVDMSPPEISYVIGKTATGADTGQLRVVIKDPQSGVDHSKTVVENLSNEVKPGVPVVNPVARSSIETFAKQVGLYDLIFPTFEPTQQADAGGGFSIASETSGSPQVLSGIVLFGNMFAANKLGLFTKANITHGKIEVNPFPLRKENPCFVKKSNKRDDTKVFALAVYDFDRRQSLNSRDVSALFYIEKTPDLGADPLKNIIVRRAGISENLLNRSGAESQQDFTHPNYQIALAEDRVTDGVYSNWNGPRPNRPLPPLRKTRLGYYGLFEEVPNWLPVDSGIFMLSLNLSDIPYTQQNIEVIFKRTDGQEYKFVMKFTPAADGKNNWEAYRCG